MFYVLDIDVYGVVNGKSKVSFVKVLFIQILNIHGSMKRWQVESKFDGIMPIEWKTECGMLCTIGRQHTASGECNGMFILCC